MITASEAKRRTKSNQDVLVSIFEEIINSCDLGVSYLYTDKDLKFSHIKFLETLGYGVSWKAGKWLITWVN